MADNKRRGKFGKAPDDASQSIFDLFEPPPEHEASSFGRIPIIRDEEGEALDLTQVEIVEAQAAAEAEAAGLQHWTEPATGQVPASLAADAVDRVDELEGPSWRGDDPNWSGPDLSDVFADTDAMGPGALRNAKAEDLLDPLASAPPSHRATTPPEIPEPSLFDRPPGGAIPAPDRAARPPAGPQTGAPAAPDTSRRGRSALGEPMPPPPAPGATPARSERLLGERQTLTGGAASPTPASAPTSARGPAPAPPARTPVPEPPNAERAAGRRSPLGGEPERGAHDAPPPPRTPPRERRDAPVADAPTGRLLGGTVTPPVRAESERPAPSALTRAADPARPAPTAERRLDGLDLDRLPPAPGASSARPPAPAPSVRAGASPTAERRPPAPVAERGADRAAAGGKGALDLAPPAPRRQTLGGPEITGEVRASRAPAPEVAPPDEYGEYDEYEQYLEPEDGAIRGIGQRILVGVALAAVVFTALGVGPLPTMILIGLLTLLAVVELFNAMRIAGLRPATLLGLVGAVAIPASTYVRGETAYPLVVGLAVVFGMLWYLTGADTERPVLNLGLTLTGILWVGGLAGFAALMLREEQGTHLLLATILITATSDTLAYVGGRAYGTKPFHVASPNKTWEGTLTGFFGALLAGLAIGVTNLIGIFDVDGGFTVVMILALVVGVLAPIGDLAESLVKRDLGIKDMGTILPGHGGVLDRVDGLLFALPGAYYVAVVYQLF